MLNASVQAMATTAANMSEHGTVIATIGISPDDPISTIILSELNLLAIHAVIYMVISTYSKPSTKEN